MATLWDVITDNSTLPVQPGNTFWDHLNNQAGGGEVSTPVVEKLINLVRIKVDDLIGPVNFTDAAILSMLNEAQNEFCTQTLCLFDKQSTVNVLALENSFTLPIGTVLLNAVYTSNLNLRIVTQHELDYGYFNLNGEEVLSHFSNWRTATGKVAFALPSLGVEEVRVIPIPTEDITLTLERYRLPNSPISIGTIPEVAPQFYPDLVIGAVAYLLDIPRLETYSKELADLQRDKWEEYLGLAQQSLQTDLRATTRMLPLPEGVKFMEFDDNTNGADQNVNTGAQ